MKTRLDRLIESLIFEPGYVHPLSKALCSCGNWVMEKDRKAHLELEHIAETDDRPRPEMPSDEELDAMFESWQSEREAYQIAH
jgi:hypothetical protein